MTDTDMKAATSGIRTAEWNWLPQLPVEYSPLFAWPPHPVLVFRWFFRTWLPLSDKVIFVLLAGVSWFFFHPELEQCEAFEFGWIAQIYIRNMGLMFLVAGGLHLYFYTFGKQGSVLRYDSRDSAGDGRRFTWGSQVWDNMFWSCLSGVAVWTAYEALMMWSFANNYVDYLDWRENVVWFGLCFLLTPIWSATHFYLIHRLLHWPPLYEVAHSLHHRNSNIGP